MFISPVIIGIVFRLLNFALLIVLGVYLFRKYGKSLLVELLVKKDAEQELLLSEKIFFEKKQSELELLIKQEARDCEKLREKIDLWKQAVDNENVYYEQEREKIAMLIEKRIMQRTQQEERGLIQLMVLEKLIPQLEKELTHYFHEEKNVLDYTNAIVRFMDEG